MAKVSDILYKVRTLLQDTDGVRWLDEELLTWLNEGCLEMVRLLPTANAQMKVFQLAAGTLQAIPSDSLHFLTATRNMDSGGTVPSTSILPIERNILDTERPDWHSEPALAKVRYVITEPDYPQNFYVYPPQPDAGMGYIEAVVSVAPVEIATDGTQNAEPFPLLAQYAPQVTYYICYRAFHKQVNDPAARERAQEFYQLFTTNTFGESATRQNR